jgi:hypothetical protein
VALAITGGLAAAGMAHGPNSATRGLSSERPLLHDTKIKGSLKLLSSKKARVKTMRLKVKNGERKSIKHAELEGNGFRATKILSVTATRAPRSFSAAQKPRVRLAGGGKIEITGVPGLTTLTVDFKAAGGGVTALFEVDNLGGRHAGSVVLAWGKYDLLTRIEPANYSIPFGTQGTPGFKLVVANSVSADGDSPPTTVTVTVVGPFAGSVSVLCSGGRTCQVRPLGRGDIDDFYFQLRDYPSPGTVQITADIPCRSEEKRCDNNPFPRRGGNPATLTITEG